MASTIFCTFARAEFADFAAGRLPQEVAGIQSIKRVKPKNTPEEDPPAPGVRLASWGTAEHMAAASVPDRVHATSSAPVTLKIICDAASRARVICLLQTMQGYRILASG